MNVLDWVLVAAIVISALWGYKTGLINAVVNAVVVYVGLFLSGLFAGRVLATIWDGVESESLSTAIGYVIIFVGVFIAGRIVAGIIKRALKVTMLDWTDSLGGLVIGLVAGVLIAGGLVTVVARYSFVESEESAASEISVNDIVTDGIQGLQDEITGRTIDYAANLGRENGRTWLVESQLVPTLLNLRSFVIDYAPEEFGVALDRLEQAIDQADA
jgi:membrane protein required for colicin V production